MYNTYPQQNMFGLIRPNPVPRPVLPVYKGFMPLSEIPLDKRCSVV